MTEQLCEFFEGVALYIISAAHACFGSDGSLELSFLHGSNQAWTFICGYRYGSRRQNMDSGRKDYRRELIGYCY